MAWSKMKAAFMGKIRKRRDGCWQFGNNIKGYAIFYFEGKLFKAHRFAFELFGKKNLVDGDHVIHSCGFKPCANPDHLFVTSREGKKFYAWRLLRGLGLKEFADSVGAGYNTAYQWERRGRRPIKIMRDRIKSVHSSCPLAI